jgi:hypothetical protein
LNKNTTNQDHNQGQPDESNLRAKKRRRTWDSVIVGIGFSLAFVLLFTKVAHVTPCEAIDRFNIDTKTCILVSNGSSTKAGELATQHGLGFAIIIQYGLLVLEMTDALNDHVQQFLQNIGLQ